MSFITYQEFIADCDEQDVAVNGVVARAGEYGVSDSSYAPTDTLSMLLEAGNELRLSPEHPLIDKPFTAPEYYASDAGAVALASILNQSLEAISPAKHEITCSYARKIASCAMAEVKFLQTLIDLRPNIKKPEPSEVFYYGAQLFLHDDEVVLMRKWRGEKSALTFKDIAINGITYPAGSLLRTEIPADYIHPSTGEQLTKSLLYHTPAGTEILPFEIIMNATFVRLSALAYEPKQRREFDDLTDYLSYVDKAPERDLYFYHTLQELSDAVQQVADASDRR
jgi:hypothetical protein